MLDGLLCLAHQLPHVESYLLGPCQQRLHVECYREELAQDLESGSGRAWVRELRVGLRQEREIGEASADALFQQRGVGARDDAVLVWLRAYRLQRPSKVPRRLSPPRRRVPRPRLTPLSAQTGVRLSRRPSFPASPCSKIRPLTRARTRASERGGCRRGRLPASPCRRSVWAALARSFGPP